MMYAIRQALLFGWNHRSIAADEVTHVVAAAHLVHHNHQTACFAGVFTPLSYAFLCWTLFDWSFLGSDFRWGRFLRWNCSFGYQIDTPFWYFLNDTLSFRKLCQNSRMVVKFFLPEDVTVYGNTTASFAR
jgi:hypothetical protein